jgi:hypothetical protein
VAAAMQTATGESLPGARAHEVGPALRGGARHPGPPGRRAHRHLLYVAFR